VTSFGKAGTGIAM